MDEPFRALVTNRSIKTKEEVSQFALFGKTLQRELHFRDGQTELGSGQTKSKETWLRGKRLLPRTGKDEGAKEDVFFFTPKMLFC